MRHAAPAPAGSQVRMTMKTFFEQWRIDRRFWYVFFASHDNEFNNGSGGPCLAVIDDFGHLVPSDRY